MNGKNSIHKTKNMVTVFPTIKYVHNTFYMLLNDNIFPHLIEKEILFILAKWLDNHKLIFYLCIDLSSSITYGSCRCCESHPVYCTQKKKHFSAYSHLNNENSNFIGGSTYRKKINISQENAIKVKTFNMQLLIIKGLFDSH